MPRFPLPEWLPEEKDPWEALAEFMAQPPLLEEGDVLSLYGPSEGVCFLCGAVLDQGACPACDRVTAGTPEEGVPAAPVVPESEVPFWKPEEKA